jgi:hypothetical protein
MLMPLHAFVIAAMERVHDAVAGGGLAFPSVQRLAPDVANQIRAFPSVGVTVAKIEQITRDLFAVRK